MSTFEIVGWIVGGVFCAAVMWAMILSGLIERGLDYTNDAEDDLQLDSVRAKLQAQKEGTE